LFVCVAAVFPARAAFIPWLLGLKWLGRKPFFYRAK
jgi:hypothetical protein